MERSYGSFNRVIPLPAGVDQKKVQAQFKNGVLSITLQKTQEEKAKGKKIRLIDHCSVSVASCRFHQK
jgi:HSP20 family protein